MKKAISLNLPLFLIITLTLISCKKDDGPDNPPTNSLLVKYEITGNYTGKLDILSTTNTAAMVSYNGVLVPWTQEITYLASVMGAGIGGNSSSSNPGIPGQSITLKVFSGGKLIYTKSATTNANGILGVPTYAFVFQ